MTITRDSFDFEDHFAKLPNAWMRDGRLSLRARGLLALLMTHRPGWKVSLESLVKENPEGRDAIRTAMNELREAGYLTTEVRKTDGGRLDGHEYRLSNPWTPDFTALLETRSSGNPPLGESDPKEDHSQEDHSEETPPTPPTGGKASTEVAVIEGPTVHELFAEAWTHWPRNQGKKVAEDKFMRAVRHHPGKAAGLAVDVARFGDAYRLSHPGVDVQFVPHLATWLHQQRWTDDLPARHAPATPTDRTVDTMLMGRELQREADARARGGQADLDFGSAGRITP